MNLPEELEQQFQEELKAFEEARQMRYIPTWERKAKLEEKRSIALNLLRKNLDLETIAEVTGLTIEQLQQLQTQNEQN